MSRMQPPAASVSLDYFDGLYMAKELTGPVERLVNGARQVGSGNLDVTISATGHDEIAVLVDSFNHMTRDLKENRERLTQASADLEASSAPLPLTA